MRRRWLLLGVDLRGSSAVIVWGHLHLLHLRRSVLVNVWRRMIQWGRMVKMRGRLMMHRSHAGRGSAQFRSCIGRNSVVGRSCSCLRRLRLLLLWGRLLLLLLLGSSGSRCRSCDR